MRNIYTNFIPPGIHNSYRYARKSVAALYRVIITFHVRSINFFIDLLNSVDNLHSYERNITLEVNSTDPTQYITRELNWYHNNELLSNASNVVITNGNKTLTTVVDGDAGVYEVRYDGLLLQPYDSVCEKMVMDITRHYPLLKPARFSVNMQLEGILCN